MNLFDFTLSVYNELLVHLFGESYELSSLSNYLAKYHTHSVQYKSVILRHDVDRSPLNAVKTAELESQLGINSTYYFRIVPESYDKNVMNKIAAMGHEIGYHYEDVDLIMRNRSLKVTNSFGKVEEDKLIDLAYENFCKNLETFRQNFDIKTICMHGSPLSKYDNKLIWTKYDYKELGIIGEPYYDINWDEFAYFTDTGRRWNGNGVSIRDKVNTPYKYNYKTTRQIIDNIDKLPDKIMFTIHPERWNDDLLPWIKEMIYQNIKNVFKKVILYKNKIESI